MLDGNVVLVFLYISNVVSGEELSEISTFAPSSLYAEESQASTKNTLQTTMYLAINTTQYSSTPPNTSPPREAASLEYFEDPSHKGASFATSQNIAVPNEVLERIKAQPAVNSAIDAILVLVVIQTMLGLGCTMDIALIKEHLMQPRGIAIAAACQFGFMPLIGFIMAKAFALDKVAALAVLVTSSCPGGNLSNLLTYFLYGDMNLSILMSTASTLLALAFMPICLFAYGSSWIAVSSIGRMIPFGGVILTLIITLFPVAVGILIKARYEKVANTMLKISLFSVFVSFVALMTLSVILFGVSAFTAISATSYVIAFIMPLIGYGAGYGLAKVCGLQGASRRTVAIETGCQNSQLSSTILKMAFAPQTMGAYFLFPIYYALFQGLEGAALIVAFRLYRRYYADDVMVPTSRITYDKFDEEWSDDRGQEGGQSPISSHREAVFGKLSMDEHEGTARSTEVPDNLPLKKRFSPAENEPRRNDRSALLPVDQKKSTGLADYGGLG